MERKPPGLIGLKDRLGMRVSRIFRLPDGNRMRYFQPNSPFLAGSARQPVTR